MICGDIIQLISVGILFLTLVAVIFYTYETNKLRKETFRQTELQLRPCITMRKSGEDKKAVAMNIGHSPALNIEIEDINIKNQVISFQRRNLLKPDKDRMVKIIKKNIENPKEERKIEKIINDFPFFNKNDLPEGHYQLTIKYKNIENKKYRSILKIHCDTRIIELLKTGKLK